MIFLSTPLDSVRTEERLFLLFFICSFIPVDFESNKWRIWEMEDSLIRLSTIFSSPIERSQRRMHTMKLVANGKLSQSCSCMVGTAYKGEVDRQIEELLED